mmetsp:Transcript_9656/g.21524  ORF Transcript_9656/g.21524 Transcript_9656/m.21524 type:complete len:229 (+) Transcript_9656:365-1051(+)
MGCLANPATRHIFSREPATSDHEKDAAKHRAEELEGQVAEEHARAPGWNGHDQPQGHGRVEQGGGDSANGKASSSHAGADDETCHLREVPGAHSPRAHHHKAKKAREEGFGQCQLTESEALEHRGHIIENQGARYGLYDQSCNESAEKLRHDVEEGCQRERRTFIDTPSSDPQGQGHCWIEMRAGRRPKSTHHAQQGGCDCPGPHSCLQEYVTSKRHHQEECPHKFCH